MPAVPHIIRRSLYVPRAPALLRLGRVHHNVSNLSAKAFGPMNHFPIQYDAAAYPCSQRDKNSTAVSLAAPLPVFPHGGHVGVIARSHRNPLEQCRKLLRRNHIMPVQIDAAFHFAIIPHRSRYANAYPGNLLHGIPMGRNPGRKLPGHCRQDPAPMLPQRSGSLPLAYQLPFHGKYAIFGGCATDVNANVQHTLLHSPSSWL